MYIEVFKTDVQEVTRANTLLKILLAEFPDCLFNFDLDDCDKILRAKGAGIENTTPGVIKVVAATGHLIEVLPD